MELYLVRHGETEWSRARRHTGRTDVPLNEVGEAEAKALGDHLRGLEADHVLSSPRSTGPPGHQLPVREQGPGPLVDAPDGERVVHHRGPPH
ncbi:MAG TPA: histidine phosphatase family protein, partial [Actinomycetes bacterium]|nr:histidine phosphatase family protein [Actinomycetes bacterium]